MYDHQYLSIRAPQSSVLTPTAAVPYLAISLGPLTCIDRAHSARAGGIPARYLREGFSDTRAAAEASCVPPRQGAGVSWRGDVVRRACSSSGLGFVLGFGFQPAIEISNADQADAEANERTCPPQAFQVPKIQQKDLENRKADDAKRC